MLYRAALPVLAKKLNTEKVIHSTVQKFLRNFLEIGHKHISQENQCIYQNLSNVNSVHYMSERNQKTIQNVKFQLIISMLNYLR